MKITLIVLVVLVAALGGLIIALNVVQIQTIDQQQVQVQHVTHELQQQEKELDKLEQFAHIHL